MEFRGSTVRLQALAAFPCADFALPQPRVLRVLSIGDRIRLEVDFPLRPASWRRPPQPAHRSVNAPHASAALRHTGDGRQGDPLPPHADRGKRVADLFA